MGMTLSLLYCSSESHVDSVREDSRRVGIILATAGLLSAALKEGSLWIGASLVTAGLALMLLGYLEDENDES